MNELYVAFCIVLIVCRRRHYTYARKALEWNSQLPATRYTYYDDFSAALDHASDSRHEMKLDFTSLDHCCDSPRDLRALYWFQSPKQSEKITLSSMARVRLALVINWNWRWSHRAVAGNWDNESAGLMMFSHIELNRKKLKESINSDKYYLDCWRL